MYDLEFKTQQVSQTWNGLHIPTLMPDEFFYGYRGRVNIINALGSTSNTNRVLTAWVKQCNPEAEVVPIVYSLAKLLGIDVETFIRQHTLAPITSTIKSKLAHSKPDAEEQQNLNLQGMLVQTSKKIKKAACLCKYCAREDLSYLGFSFWRRSHQLSGIDWCTKHNAPLCEVSEDDPYANEPARYLINKRFNEINTETHNSHPVILRYAQLVQDALDLTVPLDFKITSQVLLNKSKKFNIRTRNKGNKQTLSDLILEQLPDDWLAKHFPNLKKVQHGDYLYSFDDILRPNSVSKSCINTLLAAAVLFKNADEAIFELTKNQYKLPRAIKPKASDKVIIENYIKHQGNIKQVASELEQVYRSLLAKTSRLGLPALTRLDRTTLDAIKSFYNGGDLLTLINKPGVNPEMFSSVIRTAGAQFSSTMNRFRNRAP